MKRLFCFFSLLVLALACGQSKYYKSYADSLIDEYAYEGSYPRDECLLFFVDKYTLMIIPNYVFRGIVWGLYYSEKYPSYRVFLEKALNHPGSVDWDLPCFEKAEIFHHVRIPCGLLKEAEKDFSAFKKKYLKEDKTIGNTLFWGIDPHYEERSIQIAAICFKKGLFVEFDKWQRRWYFYDHVILIPTVDDWLKEIS